MGRNWFTGGARASAQAVTGRMIVARFKDGSTIKGTTHDFAPNKPVFHVYRGGDESSKALAVPLEKLKAVFFVKSYGGASGHRYAYSFDKSRGYGRKALVMFEDNEIIAGYTMGYNPEQLGFFLTPADDDGNNFRIYVVNKAVKTFRWF